MHRKSVPDIDETHSDEFCADVMFQCPGHSKNRSKPLPRLLRLTRKMQFHFTHL